MSFIPIDDRNEVQVRYACPVCHKQYDTHAEADKCMRQPFDDCGWKVGDWLLIPQCAAYQRGDADDQLWLAFEEPAWPKSKSHFDHQHKYHFWYTIVGVGAEHEQPHRALVVVYTKPPVAHALGWNPADGAGHKGLYRPGDVSGATAEGCIIHDLACKFRNASDEFLCEQILRAKPPTHLNENKGIAEAIERVKRNPRGVPLL